MGLRFRRRIRVLPGLHVNLSKTGVSASVGRRGASITLGKRGAQANLGLPGTGLSYATRLGKRKTQTEHAPTPNTPHVPDVNVPRAPSRWTVGILSSLATLFLVWLLS